MTNAQNTLASWLQGDHTGFDAKDLQVLPLPELAELFVDIAFLASGFRCYLDEHWLQKKKSDFSLPLLSVSLFKEELAPIAYLKDIFDQLSFSQIQDIQKRASFSEEQIIQQAMEYSYPEQKIFLDSVLARMSDLFLFESQLQGDKKSKGLHLALSLYRTFDRLDQIFHLEYAADIGMKVNPQQAERLYEGAGVGVQSGYSTVVTALQNLNLPAGARVIDLGSGYGRVGMVVGLMRPDLDFLGYEFVEHRVNIAQDCSKNLGLESHVRFITQDLSLPDFEIPEADVYYLYDPFTEETYQYVLKQLIKYSHAKPIVIVTKGNARKWLSEIAKNQGWPAPVEFDDGNLCFFRSQVDENLSAMMPSLFYWQSV